MRLRDPKTTALIYKSGKIVCLGARNCDLSKLAAKKYAKIIKHFGFDVKFTDFKIHNIVGSCDVGFGISLSSLQAIHKLFCKVFYLF